MSMQDYAKIRDDFAHRYRRWRDQYGETHWEHVKVLRLFSIDRVLDDFMKDPKYGGQCDHESKLPVTKWLLEEVRKEKHVKFEKELGPSDGADTIQLELDFNYDQILCQAAQQNADGTMCRQPNKWIMQFYCSGKSGLDRHKCWTDLCPDCPIGGQLIQMADAACTPFEEKHGFRIDLDAKLRFARHVKVKNGYRGAEKLETKEMTWREFMPIMDDFLKKHKEKVFLYDIHKKFVTVTFQNFQFLRSFKLSHTIRGLVNIT